jgi:hypothetical protein
MTYDFIIIKFYQIKVHITVWRQAFSHYNQVLTSFDCYTEVSTRAIIHHSVYLYTKVKCVCMPSDSSNLEASIPCIESQQVMGKKEWKDPSASVDQVYKESS